MDAEWKAVAGATGYSIQSRPENSTAWTTHTVPGGATEKTTIPDLTVDTIYHFRIATMNSAGTGTYTTDVASTMPGTGPPADIPVPTSVGLTPMERTKIKVAWEHGVLTPPTTDREDQRRIAYEIGYTDAASPTAFSATVAPQVVVVVPDRSAKEHVLTNLTVDKSYLIAVRNVWGDANGNVVGKSDWAYRSAPRREMTPAESEVPQNVEVTGGDGSLTVTWNADKNKAAKEYLVEWRARNQSYDDPERQKKVAHPSSGTTVETTISGLTNGTEYHVIVSSMNERGGGFTSAPSVEAARATPMAPTLAAPNPVEAMAGDGEVTVKWTAVKDATKYRIQWRTESQSYDSTRQREGFYAYRTGDLVLQDTVPDLMNGTKYMFQVSAINDEGMSDPSDEVSAMPMVPTPALPVFGALVLGAGLVAAGRRRLRARQRRLLNA